MCPSLILEEQTFVLIAVMCYLSLIEKNHGEEIPNSVIAGWIILVRFHNRNLKKTYLNVGNMSKGYWKKSIERTVRKTLRYTLGSQVSGPASTLFCLQ